MDALTYRKLLVNFILFFEIFFALTVCERKQSVPDLHGSTHCESIKSHQQPCLRLGGPRTLTTLLVETLTTLLVEKRNHVLTLLHVYNK
jgi:hypothetical protein